jgi:hypothetical protein
MDIYPASMKREALGSRRSAPMSKARLQALVDLAGDVAFIAGLMREAGDHTPTG